MFSSSRKATASDIGPRIDANLRKAEIDGQFIAGEGNVQVQLTVENGGHLALISPRLAPVLIEPLVRMYPENKVQLVGRDEVLARLMRSIAAGGLELVGEDGVGKTALISHALAQIADSAVDRLVYVDCRDYDSPKDIIAAMFFASYDCDYAIAPAPQAIATYLQAVTGLVALDHVHLAGDELQSVVRAISRCVCVAIGTNRRLSGQAPFMRVVGLRPQDGAALVMRELGRVFTPEEEAELQELSRAWDGHPLRLHRCVDLLREGDAEVTDLIQTGRAVDRVVGLDGLVAATLTDDERRLLMLVAAVMPGVIPVDGLVAAAAGADIDALLRRLLRKGLIEAHSPRYSARAPLTEVIIGDPIDREGVAVGTPVVLAKWVQDVDFATRRAAIGTLVQTQAMAAKRDDAESVVAIARGLSPVLALTGRWDAWQRTLGVAEAAARAKDDSPNLAWALHEQGVRATCAGEFGQAESCFAAAAGLRERIGDYGGAMASARNLEVARHLAQPTVVEPDVSEAVAEEEQVAPWWIDVADELEAAAPAEEVAAAAAEPAAAEPAAVGEEDEGELTAEAW